MFNHQPDICYLEHIHPSIHPSTVSIHLYMYIYIYIHGSIHYTNYKLFTIHMSYCLYRWYMYIYIYIYISIHIYEMYVYINMIYTHHFGSFPDVDLGCLRRRLRRVNPRARRQILGAFQTALRTAVIWETQTGMIGDYEWKIDMISM